VDLIGCCAIFPLTKPACGIFFFLFVLRCCCIALSGSWPQPSSSSDSRNCYNSVVHVLPLRLCAQNACVSFASFLPHITQSAHVYSNRNCPHLSTPPCASKADGLSPMSSTNNVQSQLRGIARAWLCFVNVSSLMSCHPARVRAVCSRSVLQLVWSPQLPHCRLLCAQNCMKYTFTHSYMLVGWLTIGKATNYSATPTIRILSNMRPNSSNPNWVRCL
jgi:hypothetical protein